MIDFGSEAEKAKMEVLIEEFGNDIIRNIIFESGVKTDSETRELAKFYWFLVASAKGENMDYWLEKIYTSFHIHVGNAGFESVWDEELP